MYRVLATIVLAGAVATANAVEVFFPGYASVSITGPQSFRVFGGVVDGEIYLANFSWRPAENMFVPTCVAGWRSDECDAQNSANDRVTALEIDISQANGSMFDPFKRFNPQKVRLEGVIVNEQRYWAEFLWNAATNVWELDTFGLWLGEECDSECLARRLLGTWRFTFATPKTQTETFTLDHITKFDRWAAVGTDQRGESVFPHYNQDRKRYQLLQRLDDDTFRHFYFDFTSPSTVAGCYQLSTESGSSDCRPMSGVRVAEVAESWPFVKVGQPSEGRLPLATEASDRSDIGGFGSADQAMADAERVYRALLEQERAFSGMK